MVFQQKLQPNAGPGRMTGQWLDRGFSRVKISRFVCGDDTDRCSSSLFTLKVGVCSNELLPKFEVVGADVGADTGDDCTADEGTGLGGCDIKITEDDACACVDKCCPLFEWELFSASCFKDVDVDDDDDDNNAVGCCVTKWAEFVGVNDVTAVADGGIGLPVII